jgi:hypothetical protein
MDLVHERAFPRERDIGFDERFSKRREIGRERPQYVS